MVPVMAPVVALMLRPDGRPVAENVRASPAGCSEPLLIGQP
jgi:hypothetical protein